MTKRKKIVFISLGILALLVGAFVFYTSFYYHAKDVSEYLENNDQVDVYDEDDYIAFYGHSTLDYKVVILYPGAKVESKAYAPLAQSLAKLGHHVYVVKMPGKLAFMDVNAADAIIKYEEKNYNRSSEDIYVAGHSLGGATLGMYLNKNSSKVAGVIFLAAYVTKDLSNTNLKGLSIYGSEDKVLNQANYEKNKSNLPKNTTEIIIEGGCHAYFASYGEQKGDGIATITREEQILQTATAIDLFMSF